MHQSSAWSCISHRRTVYFPAFKPVVPVCLKGGIVHQICQLGGILQRQLLFVCRRLYVSLDFTCCFCHTLCAPNAFRTLIPHAFWECVLPLGRPTVARTVTIKAGFQSTRFGFRKTSNYIFIHCLCFVLQVFYSTFKQAFHFQTSKSANHLLSANCTHHAATALKQRHSNSFHFVQK